MRQFFLSLTLILSSLTAFAQLEWVPQHPGTITYTLDLENVQQHELRITVDFPAVGPGIFRVKMPQSSPGRYAQHNFAKNVYDLKAFGADGAAVDVYQEGIAAWAVAGHGGAVTLEYTLFANGGDGTYSGIDDRKLHLNMPASFLYGDVLNDRPVMLKIKDGQRTDWTVATQLVEVGNRAYAAPNYYYFFDSPTIVGTIMRDQFEVTNPDGNTQTIEVAMMHEGTREEFDDYVEWTKKVVLAQQKVYGEIPTFDYGKYTFLCSYNPWIGGDGMEHRNSTICSSTGNLGQHADRLIGTVSHEFFHCWNVERIRPASLEPFSFDHANMSGELWFAEGFTSYYDDLSLVRAGILSPEDYAKGLTGQLNYVLLRPGRDHRNAIEMSQQAPFVDAATANDPDNFGNTFVSYYPYGATIGLALDLTLRERGHTLDEVMKLIWQRYGKTEIPYHIRDLQLALGEVVGDQAWAKDWFADYVYQSELPNIGALLDNYGFVVEPAHPDTAGFMGLRLRDGGDVVTVRGPVAENSPLYEAGLDEGSKILSLNGQPVNSQDSWDAIVSSLEIGKTYEISFEQLGQQKTGRFTAAVSPELKIRFEEGNRKAKKAREDWLWRE
ncbi:M61 family metallopeptidase [Neolewinella aurantiaca]|uniref:M61 family metallopeptidase n=1 Tax=Neolewinella aurantiaca TaxID=2602767 RepID=A0A5C7FMM6_9BACT|nr:PDZ domain-containing protein [Neolewinella aurantiaca]TXF86015.1 M61 family metallopeptidase [Neolewinella aurantiaca]